MMNHLGPIGVYSPCAIMRIDKCVPLQVTMLHNLPEHKFKIAKNCQIKILMDTYAA